VTTIVAPICLGCVLFHQNSSGMSCDAFPQGIPIEIVTSQVDHRQPVDGDHGRRFVPVDDAAAAYAEEVFS
jgi:hypothetical protein